MEEKEVKFFIKEKEIDKSKNSKIKSSKAIRNLYMNEKDLSFEIKERNNRSTSKYTSRIKINNVITQDTLIYEILFDNSIDDDKRHRNYDRVSREIKEIEQKNEIKKMKLKKKINLISQKLNDNMNQTKGSKDIKLIDAELSLRAKTLEMKELDKSSNLNYYELIQKLKIPPEHRTIKDIIQIKPFIEKTNLAKNFKEEFTNINIIEKLINFCCIEMYYKRYKEGDIIYKIGDAPKEFYSIIYGKINIIKAIQNSKMMSGFQYFCYLMNLRKNNDIYIFHKTIEANSNNYDINVEHIDIIHYIYLVNYLKTIKNKELHNISFLNLLELINIIPEELGIDTNQINSINYIINNTKIIIKKIPITISQNLIRKYSFFDDDLIKKNVILYNYEISENLKANDYFGDDIVKDEHSSTAISEDNTEVAVLPIKLYNSEIALLKSIVIDNRISILHSYQFFNKIKYQKFKHKYFKFFKSETYYKGDILFKEGQPINNLYFIQEGSLQLYISKSMNEIESLIELLIKMKNSIKLNKVNNSKKEKDNLNYSLINSSQEELVNYLEQRQMNKFLVLTDNEEVGFISNFLGDKYLTSCVVESQKAKIYKMEVKYLNQILNEEKECIEEYNNRIKMKLNLFIKTLFKMNNIKLIMIDEKINLKKSREKDTEEKMKIIINSSNIKGMVNYNKLNYVLTENNQNFQNKQKLRNYSLNLPRLSKDKDNSKSIKKKSFENIFENEKDKEKDIKQSKNKIFMNNINYNNNEKINKNKKSKSIFINGSRKSINSLLFQLNKKQASVNKETKISKIKLSKKKTNRNINQIMEKLFITPSSPNSILSSKNKIKKKSDFISLSNDFSINQNPLNIETEKNLSHPYYEPKLLIKKNKYKIFENNNRNKKFVIENMKLQLSRLRQLKNIHCITKNYNINDYNLENINNNKI